MINIPRGIIVSCQAAKDSPLKDAHILACLAKSAELGGAIGIRADSVEEISAIRSMVSVPIFGINKMYDATGRIVITPDFDSAEAIAKAGADVIALDATFQESNIRADVKETIRLIHERLQLPVMADISTLEEAERAAAWGADIVATTLSGYLPGKPYAPEDQYRPNLPLLKSILESPHIQCPVIGEGRFWEVEDIKAAFDMGVHAIVIGKAITNAYAITTYYTKSCCAELG